MKCMERSDPELSRRQIYVRDHCSGVAWALEHGELGEAYNVRGGNTRTNIEVTRKVLAMLNRPESLIKHIEDPRGDAHDKRYALDTTKIRSIGWQPEKQFDQALEETVRWFVDNVSWWRPVVESPEYHSTSKHTTAATSATICKQQLGRDTHAGVRPCYARIASMFRYPLMTRTIRTVDPFAS